MNQLQLAKHVGVSPMAIRYWESQGKLPKPNKDRNNWSCVYTDEQVSDIKRKINEPLFRAIRVKGKRMYNKAEASKALGISSTTIIHYIRSGRLPEPTHGEYRLRLLYSEKDIIDMRKHLKVFSKKYPSGFNIHQIQAEKGFFNRTLAANYLGMPLNTLIYWIVKKGLPKPTHKTGDICYYTQAELETLRSGQLSEYFLKRAKKKPPTVKSGASK